jgi:hypothetical protein
MQKHVLPCLALLGATLALPACTTMEPLARAVWAHPQVPPELQKSRLNADAQECRALAGRAANDPSLRQMGMRLGDRLGWQILNQRDDQQESFVAGCLMGKGWRAEERVAG